MLSFTSTHPLPIPGNQHVQEFFYFIIFFAPSLHSPALRPELSASSSSIPPFLFNTFVIQQSFELFQVLFHSFRVVQCPGIVVKCPHANTIIPEMFISATFVAWYLDIEFIYHY